MQEKTILKKIQMVVSKAGARVFRNNTGSAWQGFRVFNGDHKGGPIFLKPGRYIILRDPRIVHFGLIEGSSDNIGWMPTVVTQKMVGMTVAIFLALEAKNETGTLTTPQQNFIDVVKKAGGIAGVARSEEDALQVLRDWMSNN